MHLTSAFLLSFKIILSICCLISFASCGVKSDPVPPSDTLLPSVESYYLQKEEKKEETKIKKNKK